MHTDIHVQLIQLVSAAVFGMFLGLLYDILRPAGRSKSRFAATTADALFAIAGGVMSFLFIMSIGSGKAEIWQAAFAAAGFTVYMLVFSRKLRSAVHSVLTFAGESHERIVNFFKKT